jgi:hypothetical protein
VLSNRDNRSRLSSSRIPHVSQFGWIGDCRELIHYQQSSAATKCGENGVPGKAPRGRAIPGTLHETRNCRNYRLEASTLPIGKRL